jgi:hypothetical protein
MSDRPRAGRSDGVTIAPGSARGKSIALLAGAVALACIALLVLFGRPETRSDAPQTTPETSQAPPPVAAPSPIEPGAVAAPADEAPAPGASVLPKAPPPPEPEEVAAVAAAEAAQPEAPADEAASGIGLFPPPGTEPLKMGIVVPDDFELPEGYLRHTQVTDDGQELEPILLFHPDYQVFDENGEPMELPQDRIVPPELAPPGMPIRMLEPPAPLEPE